MHALRCAALIVAHTLSRGRGGCEVAHGGKLPRAREKGVGGARENKGGREWGERASTTSSTSERERYGQREKDKEMTEKERDI